MQQPQVKHEPLLLSTWSFGLRGHEAAWSALRDGGSGLDAVETVSRTVEADPEVDSVGRGGLPDRDGGMTLDAAVMTGPDACAGVAALSGYLHPVSIARRLLERGDALLLAGTGAELFATEERFESAELLDEHARTAWKAWRREPGVVDQGRDRGAPAPPRPIDAPEHGRLFARPDETRWKHHDTIGALAIDSQGGLAGACSTSGTPYKRPGRVGDVPLIGHGLYVDPDAGAAVATGTGELIMRVCASFLAVELMRSGATPRDALAAVLERLAGVVPRRDEHQVGLLALSPDGAWSAAALRPGFRASITTRDRHEVVEPELTWEAR
ncbi:MAG: N(4)-(beta-N-acetylglucosaminyl)-L-asparaginase [Planctomycetota bacterium]|jgi:isoaspartyl peptidase/L-asparaginase-like protein (Ntn-hydrolase superfamily)